MSRPSADIKLSMSWPLANIKLSVSRPLADISLSVSRPSAYISLSVSPPLADISHKGHLTPKTQIQCAFVGPMPIILLRMSIFFSGGTDKFDKESSQRKKSGCHT